ncbi:MAG: hypothetical protein IT434_11960 [Phycisphaerales bacterium]|jgi:hypothetical protein|nr:hypothetical protein [Phycisphaerales bacterium]
MTRFARSLVLASALTLSLASVANAQPSKNLALPKAPTAKIPDSPPVLMSYLFLIVIVGGAVGAALIPSKRGHQD